MDITGRGSDRPTDDPIALAAAINRLPVPRSWAFDPSTEDRALVPALDAVRAAPPPFRETFAAALDAQGAAVLVATAARLTPLALRYHRPIYLERALLAVALAAQATTSLGDLLTDLAMPAAAARVMGHDPAPIYEAVIAAAPAAAAELRRRAAPWEPPVPTGDPRALAEAVNRLPVSRPVTPAPSSADLALVAGLDAVLTAAPTFREAVAAALDVRGAAILVATAARLTALAARIREPLHLERALLALALAAQATEDVRDVEISLRMPALGARLLGRDPEPIYEQAIAAAPAAGADLLRRAAPWEPPIPVDEPVALATAINRLPTSPPRTPFPGIDDLALITALDAIRTAPPPFREAVAAALDNRAADILSGTALGLSALAVRTREPIHLERALLALALAAQATVDIRDVLVVVPLPGHSARLLGLDPAALCAAVAAKAPAIGAKVIRWSTPPEHSGPLAPQPGRPVGGYEEAEDADGFRYANRYGYADWSVYEERYG